MFVTEVIGEKVSCRDGQYEHTANTCMKFKMGGDESEAVRWKNQSTTFLVHEENVYSKPQHRIGVINMFRVTQMKSLSHSILYTAFRTHQSSLTRQHR